MSDYLETHAVHAEVVDQSAERKKRIEHLESCYGAQCEVLTAQASEIKQKEKELCAAKAEVDRLEGLLNTRTPIGTISLAAPGASPDVSETTHRCARQVSESRAFESGHNERRSSLPTHAYRRLATEQDTFSIPVTVVRRQGTQKSGDVPITVLIACFRSFFGAGDVIYLTGCPRGRRRWRAGIGFRLRNGGIDSR